MSWKDKAKSARLPEATERIVMRGDLLAEHDSLTEKIEEIKRSSSSLAGADVSLLASRIREIEEEIRESVVEVRLRALQRTGWRELSEAHPPRIDSEGVMDARDRIAGGINSQTMPEPMVRSSIVELDGEKDPFPREEDWQQFSEALNQGQFDRLVSLCWALNKGGVDIPFWSGGSGRTEATDAG